MIRQEAGHLIMTKPETMNELQFIEQVARTCYKSEGQITEDGESAKNLIDKLLKRGHEAMVEHWSYIFQVDDRAYRDFVNELNKMRDAGYETWLRLTSMHGRNIISGNVRAWRDYIRAIRWTSKKITEPIFSFGWVSAMLQNTEEKCWLFGDMIGPQHIGLDDSIKELSKEDLTNEEKLVHYDLTIRWTCDRGVSHELVRHRDASFGQESTRYCNYSKDKHRNQCTFIDLQPGMQLDGVVAKLPAEKQMTIYEIWCEAMQYLEVAYMQMIEAGATPQIARSVLPNSTKTEVVMTAALGEWSKFFKLRLPASAHPQMREITFDAYKDVRNMFPEIFEALKTIA